MSNSISLPANVRGFVANPCVCRAVGGDPDETRRREAERARCETAEAAANRLAAELEAARAVQRRQCENCGRRFDAFLLGLKNETGEQVIELALTLAELLVRHRLPDADMLRSIMEETLAPIGDPQGVKVRLSAADARAIRTASVQSPPMVMSSAVEIIEDPAMAPGDVLIESRNGCFDARLNARIETLKQRLLERYENGNATRPNT